MVNHTLGGPDLHASPQARFCLTLVKEEILGRVSVPAVPPAQILLHHKLEFASASPGGGSRVKLPTPFSMSVTETKDLYI